ncbi:type VII toxin-antitoxin system MntA family adenylyltransferase antitoxin [Ectobacillus ponti]|uniref:Nucleotidyltransferase domain-containing protein n=1 Tax=Ectobacillus ponti TaxID=2961894 RepID=A0AA42BU28_9BACI|nr:nucleotidyltransferase domain-containing protein [Ectobacillus ponti]MCP8970108.1 nucleotidyltransferase domain-containing protein [Ectobacillus ponti]
MAADEQARLIIEYLTPKLSPYVIYLFGSRAGGQTHPGSDFDIAYISEKKFDTYGRFIISQELAASLNADVDLIDLQMASTVFQTQVIASGVVLYCSDELKRATFEMYTLKKYARLNEERADVLENLVRRAIKYEK